MYDAFLGSVLGVTMGLPEGSPYCRISALAGERICLFSLPTYFNALFRQCADLTLLRHALH